MTELHWNKMNITADQRRYSEPQSLTISNVISRERSSWFSWMRLNQRRRRPALSCNVIETKQMYCTDGIAGVQKVLRLMKHFGIVQLEFNELCQLFITFLCTVKKILANDFRSVYSSTTWHDYLFTMLYWHHLFVTCRSWKLLYPLITKNIVFTLLQFWDK